MRRWGFAHAHGADRRGPCAAAGRSSTERCVNNQLQGTRAIRRRLSRICSAWWVRRTYYLFQMPRWDRRLRIVLDWTVALFFRPDITRVDLRVEREQVKQARELVEGSSKIVQAMQI